MYCFLKFRVMTFDLKICHSVPGQDTESSSAAEAECRSQPGKPEKVSSIKTNQCADQTVCHGILEGIQRQGKSLFIKIF